MPTEVSLHPKRRDSIRRSKSDYVKKMSGGRSRRLATIPGVKEDAAQILDKFLQSKLAARSKRAIADGQGYQAVSHVIVIEDEPQRHYTRTDSYHLASVDSILQDSSDAAHSGNEAEFDTADFRSKTASLPSSYKTRIVIDPNVKIEDILRSPARNTDPVKKRVVKTGSVPDNDSEADSSGSVKEGRKKKSLFTRTKERLRQAFRKDSADVCKVIEGKNEKDTKSSKKPNKAKKKSKSKEKKSSSKKNKEDVLAKVHTRTKTHIHQEVLHPNGNHNQPLVVRTEDTEENVDFEDEVRMRHTKKQINIKESEPGFHGVLGRIRKSFSRRKSAKDNIAASKSSEPMTSKLSLPSNGKGKGFHRANSESAAEAMSVSPKGTYSLQQRKTFSGDKRQVTDIFNAIISRGTNDNGPLSDSECSKNRSSSQSPEIVAKGKLEVPGRDGGGAGKQSQGLVGPPRTASTSSYDSRAGLSLDGLVTNRPQVPNHQGEFDLDYECDRVDEIVRTPDGEVKRKSRIRQGQLVSLSNNVSIDGLDMDMPDNADSPVGVPFEEKTEDEKDQLYDVIAKKLADIADNYTETDVESPTEELSTLEKQILLVLRNKGDQLNGEMTGSPALQVMKNLSYNAFHNTVQNSIEHDTNVKQIAMLFHLTKRAVQIAGTGGALAMQIKENTLRYFEDKFAEWIVGQGGWDSMIEETDSELD